MTFFQIYKEIRLRQAAAYHLLGNETDDIEKGEDEATSVSDLEPGGRYAETDTSKQRECWQPLRTLSFLLPSFLQQPTTPVKQAKLRPTAWLGEQTYQNNSAFDLTELINKRWPSRCCGLICSSPPHVADMVLLGRSQGVV